MVKKTIILYRILNIKYLKKNFKYKKPKNEENPAIAYMS